MSNIQEECYLNVKQVAARLGLSTDWVYRSIRAGKFPTGKHFGKARRWALSEVAEWEAAQESRVVESPRWRNAAPMDGQDMEATR